jgi:hypothetical protein
MAMNRQLVLKSILPVWLIAGTLDILGAIFILAKGDAKGTLLFIANGATAAATKLSETGQVLLGLAVHFCISLCWIIAYFLLYKRIRFDRLPLAVSALLYGCLIFFSMRFIFQPLLSTLPPPKAIHAAVIPLVIKNILILAVAFGFIPGFWASRFYPANRAPAD